MRSRQISFVLPLSSSTPPPSPNSPPMIDLSLDSPRKPSGTEHDDEDPVVIDSPPPKAMSVSPEQMAAILYIARADSLLLSLQRSFNDILLAEFAVCFMCCLMFFAHPTIYLTFFMHVPAQ